LIGHNPGLELLLLYLTKNKVPTFDDGKLLPTATLARVEIDSSWKMLSGGCGRLLTITRPSELPEKFPFPFPDGDELRDRPAYYYNQSAVVPWQIKNGKLQILVVGSSQNNHWVVPKGVGEPGMTLQASAVKEAWEEAGVKGDVDENLLGSYRYQKWGADSTVAVYAMKVQEMVSDAQWEENHRGRRWLSPKKAAAIVKQQALIPMIEEINRRFEDGELDG
jgi:phosphohistidine phosphatase